MGLTTFIIQRFSQNQAYQIKSKCIYLAQAGLHQAVYFFRFHDIAANGYFTLGQTPIDQFDTRNFFVLGGTAADMLMVNTSTASLSPNNRDLLNLRIQNATNFKTITIDRMVVTWTNTRRLQIIRINGADVWSGNLLSPANANITNFTLNRTPTIYSINYLRFSGSMSGATIRIQFVMTDGSTKTLTAYPASQNYSFTVKSTGKTTSSNIYRTIEADYNALTGKITRYDEINTQVTP